MLPDCVARLDAGLALPLTSTRMAKSAVCKLNGIPGSGTLSRILQDESQDQRGASALKVFRAIITGGCFA